MPKNLDANQIANLTGQNYLKDFLVELTKSDGTTLYWTDSPFDFARTTATSGGSKTFTGNKILGITNIEFRSFLTDTKTSIIVNDDVDLIDTLGTDYPTMTIRIYIHFRDPTDNSIDTAADPIQVFDGNVVSYSSTFNNETNTITIDCSKLLAYADLKAKISKYTTGLISSEFGSSA